MGLLFDNGNEFSTISFARENMGCDAYLCCPGPSLKLINPVNIRGRGRKVFSINTTYPYIKPDIWFGMDRIECYDRNILFEPFIKIFRAPFANSMMFDGKYVKEYPDVYWATIKKPDKGKTLFDYRGHNTHFVWHKSTLMVAIHIMVWMGAKNIYLLGCDFGGSEDYFHGKKLTDEQRKYNRRLYGAQIKHLSDLVSEGKKHEINFYSSTPNSPINSFIEYIPFDEVRKKSKEKTIFTEENTIKHVLETHKPLTVVSIYKKDFNIGEEYVYKMRDSLKQFLPKAKFVCLTDKDHIDGIETVKMKHDFNEYFTKIELFEHFKQRTLFIDLSVIIKKDITPLARFEDFTMVSDFLNPNVKSGFVMGWDGDYSHLVKKFNENLRENITKYAIPHKNKKWEGIGDSKFISEILGDDKIKTWKKGLISSYKFSNNKTKDNSSIVVFHGKPKPHEVNWNIYKNKVEKPKEKMLHIVNWGIWGGVQSVVLSISKEYSEYEHIVFSVNTKGLNKNCPEYFEENNISFKSFNGLIEHEDVKKISPKLIYLHSTKQISLENSGEWLKNYKTVRIHHGWNLGPLNVDLNWFVSDFVYGKLNYQISKHFILPPVTYVRDYLEIIRPERTPVVGRIQSQTHIGGKPFPQKFYDLMKKINAKQFIVGPRDNTIIDSTISADIVPGKMQEYLKEIDIFVIWQDKLETWCLSATEANLSGIPVVARKMNDGLTEQLEKSNGGILVNSDDEFINTINHLINDKKQRQYFAEKGKEWLVENANTRLLRGHLNDLLKK